MMLLLNHRSQTAARRYHSRTTAPSCALNHNRLNSRLPFPQHLLHRFNYSPHNPIQRKIFDSIAPTSRLNLTN